MLGQHWGSIGTALAQSDRSYMTIACHLIVLQTLLCSVHFAIELSDLSKPFKFARLKGFERLENCLTKGTYERF